MEPYGQRGGRRTELHQILFTSLKTKHGTSRSNTESQPDVFNYSLAPKNLPLNSRSCNYFKSLIISLSLSLSLSLSQLAEVISPSDGDK